jgi:histidyl-tRNA synthetase
MKFQAIRGTHDILPPDANLFELLEARSRLLFRQFGYQEIRIPTFEALELFHRTLGETTDVVEKQMYAFQDRGGRKLALRPEGTAGVVRAFVEHHLDQSAPFCKLFYIGPMFRAERPQAGRYREFWQVGAEYFGNASPTADAELLLLVEALFRSLGVEGAQLKINSLGDETCRPVYRRALLGFLEAEKPKLCEDCQRRIAKNPLRVLDCKTDGPRLGKLPTMEAFWCAACKDHFKSVCALVEKAGGKFTFSPRLVRGLDYYTRTVFEVVSSALGAQDALHTTGGRPPERVADALAAGGRYDRLVKQLGGPDIPALGFALGSERTIEALHARVPKEPSGSGDRRALVFVAAAGEGTAEAAFQLLLELRRNEELLSKGILSEGGFFEKKLGAQLTIADRLGAAFCAILGEEELAQGDITLKNLRTGSQERIPRAKLVSHLTSNLHA